MIMGLFIFPGKMEFLHQSERAVVYGGCEWAKRVSVDEYYIKKDVVIQKLEKTHPRKNVAFMLLSGSVLIYQFMRKWCKKRQAEKLSCRYLINA